MKKHKIILFLVLSFWAGSTYSQHQSKKCTLAELIVPESFSPNGDGENDILYAKAVKTNEFYFTIFDRWGEKMFESNYQDDGWNGTYKDKKVKEGVYHWFLIVKCSNGEELKKQGNTTLVRK